MLKSSTILILAKAGTTGLPNPKTSKTFYLFYCKKLEYLITILRSFSLLGYILNRKEKKLADQDSHCLQGNLNMG